MIVLDASAIADYLLGDPGRGEWVSARLDELGDEMHAPHVVDLEVASAIRRVLGRGETSMARADQAIADFLAMPLTRHPHSGLLDRVWALRASVTPYDAAYVAMAELLGAPLVTTDSRLARAPGHRATVLSPEWGPGR